MALVQVKTAAFLVREEGFDMEKFPTLTRFFLMMLVGQNSLTTKY